MFEKTDNEKAILDSKRPLDGNTVDNEKMFSCRINL